jgi:hypothetical protein
MKLAAISVAFLAASFTLVAAQTATTDPAIAPIKIDMMRPPPPPTNVNVLNFPETQAVEGTVTVSNLPAVQTVGGTVNVGNLPLDTDGAVRVASASTRAPVMFELVSAPFSVDAYGLTFPDTLDTTGYSAIPLCQRA